MGMALGSVLGMSTQAAMKFGAIAGIAAVAINTIINHWDQLFQSVGYGTDTMREVWKALFGEAKDVAVDTLTVIEERIKQLEAKPLKMAVDMAELDTAKLKLKELQEARQAWEAMGKGKGAFEKQSGAEVSGLFGEMQHGELERLRADMVRTRAGKADAGSPALRNVDLTDDEKAGIREGIRTRAMMNQGQRQAPLDTRAQEEAAIEAEARRRRDEAAKVRLANRKKAEDELGAIMAKAASGTDPNARKQLAEVLREKGVGREDLARKVEESTPAKLRPGFATAKEQQEQEQLEAQGQRNTSNYLREQAAKAKKRKEDAAEFDSEAMQVRAAENERLANAMAGGKVGRGLLANKGMSDEALQAGVRGSLSASGMNSNQVDAAVGGVARKLREKFDKEVSQRAQSRGIGADEARAQLTKEANKQAIDQRIQDLGGKTTGEFTSGAEAIYQKMQLSATAEDVRKNAGVEIAQKQLTEAEITNKKLTESQELFQRIFKNAKPGAAKFGPARGV